MRSGSSKHPASLVGRVAWVAALAAVAGGLVAVAGAGLLSERLARREQDRRLHDAALVLSGEIAGLAVDAASHAADEEAQEIAHTGMRIALYGGNARLGGGELEPPGDRSGCETVRADRRCAVQANGYVVVVSEGLDQIYAARRLLLVSGLLAIVAAGLLGAAVSRRAAAWATDPLARLGEAVRAFSIEAPRWSELREDYGCREVEAVRAAFVELVERLETALGRSQQFAADAAHELRTPLTTLRAEIELLLEREPASADHAALERMRKTLVGLQRLVERLLVLAVPGAEVFPREAVALVDVVAGVTEGLPADVRGRVQVAGDEGAVRGDETLLAAMVHNAIENALKFSEGPVGVKITEGPEVSIEISDEGPGVDEAERDVVFRPFYRSAQSRAAGVRGHGVGLALIAHVAQLHGGRAAFEDVGRGALLKVTLPPWDALS